MTEIQEGPAIWLLPIYMKSLAGAILNAHLALLSNGHKLHKKGTIIILGK